MTLHKWWGDPINRNYLYAFFKDFSFFSAVLIPFFTDWGHLALFHVQIIQSWFSIWMFVLEVPTGAIADKIGRKHSIALGSLIIGLAVLIYGSVPRFEIFLLAEFLFAIGFALTSGADQALLYDTLKEEGRESESKKILGRADSFHLLGILVAAPVGSLIASGYGINAPMLMSSIPFLIASAVGWSIPEPKIRSDASESPRYLDIVKQGLRTIRHNKVVRTLAIDSVLVSVSAYFVLWLYQPLLKQMGIPILYFGLVHAMLLCVEMAVAANFAFVEKIIGTGKKYVTRSALLVTGGFVTVALFPHIATLGLLLILGGGIGYTRATYIASIANKYIESRERATVLSSIGMLRRFTLIFLNPIIGYIATHSLSLALITVGLLPLGALLIKEEIE